MTFYLKYNTFNLNFIHLHVTLMVCFKANSLLRTIKHYHNYLKLSYMEEWAISLCLSVCLSICLSVCLSMSFCLYLSVCLSVYLSLSVCLSLSLPEEQIQNYDWSHGTAAYNNVAKHAAGLYVRVKPHFLFELAT